MAVIFALITLIGWGAGDIFVALSSRRLGAKQAYFWGMAFAFVLASAYIPFAGEMTDWGMFFIAILLNVVHIFGNLAYFKGLEIGKTAVVGTLSGAFVLVTILISLLLFGENLNLTQILGIVLIISGGIMVSLKLDNSGDNIRGILTDKGIIYALAACLGWGIYFALVRIPAERIGWFYAGYPLYLLTFLLPFFMKEIRKNIFAVFSAVKVLIPVFIFTILITVADFSYNIGILQGFTSIVAPIAGAYPVLFVILSRFVFREKLNGQQKAGIFFALLGIVLIGISSV